MSLSPHQGGAIKSISKHNVEAISESIQDSGDLFYSIGDLPLEQTHSSPECLIHSSPEIQSVFKGDKGYQAHEQTQQSGPLQWVHQDPTQTSKWFQSLPNMNKWSQGFGTSLGATDDQRIFSKKCEPAQEKLAPGSSQAYIETSHIGADWDHHTMVSSMPHAQFQPQHQSHQPGDIQYQQQAMHQDTPESPLQPFQLAFGPTKQQQQPFSSSSFQQVFQDNSASGNMNYGEPKVQQHILQQMHHQHHLQQLQQMHQLQQQHQINQQQRLHQMQQQYLQHQKMQQLQHQTPGFQHLDSRVKPEMEPQDLGNHQEKKEWNQIHLSVPRPQQSVPQGSVKQEPDTPAENNAPDHQETQHQIFPRRSRRLSKDGISPPGNQTSKDKESAQNGGGGATSVGVIQSTQRRRRASKEINLETLAQKASEMEFLPSKYEEITSSRSGGMVPLVIPVSVPVRKGQPQVETSGSWAQQDHVRHPTEISQPDRKPSVIVARRHSLKNSESFNQAKGQEDKSKRRPRPGPLVIPHPCTFITPSIYSSISAYQSNLRSPVRLPENASIIPPYTPPPILSPAREGSGLYFSAVLSSMAGGSQVLPPPPTPRSASRSLLRSSSSEATPSAPSLIEAAPVSLEPHINIGSQYQAEIPELRDRSVALKDLHKASLLWVPESTPSQDTRFDDLMNLVCSSVMYGGGTNIELAMHCLQECRGDVMEALEIMLMKNPVHSRHPHLANYHYAGSDCWTVDEKRYFNKGISAYRKDFFLVQKLVRSKTVSQCVEFYYTYKKQVKVGRNGTCTYGPSDPEEILPVMHVRQTDENGCKLEESQYNVKESSHNSTKTLQDNQREMADVAQEIWKSSSVGKEESCGLMPEAQSSFKTPSPLPPRPRTYNTARRSKPSAGNKPQGEPEGIFPCKKCGRVFYKVKSRSAHMKSHAEQEKKAAAAQRQREEEELAIKAQQQMMLVAATRSVASHREGPDESSEAEESPGEADDDRDEDWK